MNNGPDNLLVDDHSELGEMLEEVFAELRNGSGSRAFAHLDRFWARLAMHIRAEHLHLFPALLKASERGSASSIANLLTQLREDHNFFMSELAEAIKAMRLMPDDDDGASLPGLLEVKERLENVSLRLTIHNDIEETRVYPLAGSLLSPAEAAETRAGIKKELDRLPPRFVGEAKGRNDSTA